GAPRRPAAGADGGVSAPGERGMPRSPGPANHADVLTHLTGHQLRNMGPITLLVADNHRLMRRVLCRDLERMSDLSIIGEAGSTAEAVAKARQLGPRVAIVEAQLPEAGGADACRQIVAESAATAVVVLSAVDCDIKLARAWAAGAVGFITTEAEPAELVRAIRRAADGGSLFTTAQRQRVRAWRQQVEARLRTLTQREREVLDLLVTGATNAELANDLCISIKTVEFHVSQLLAKLDVSSRRDIIAWSRRVQSPLPSFGESLGFFPDDWHAPHGYADGG
ncbi:MAG TPA: response regulator transcription factor, partial [Chloroflexota bacterium]|nr:response regulator transcription factor [Chloroflexota bacterium]